MTWAEALQPYRTNNIQLFADSFIDRWGSEEWNPTGDDRKAAGKLHTQIVSRITTQPLGYLSGVEESALKSIYALFERTRKIVDECRDCQHFDALAWHVLNTHVRPFTAKWHRESQRGAFSALDATDEFRAGLAALQPVLQCFDDLLLHIRDARQPPPRRELLHADGAAEMEGEVRWGIPEHFGGIDPGTAAKINGAEDEAVRARRKHYGISEDKPHAVALALSGGGIRSATFSLGVLVALARRGVLPQFDYLSTVSGGGYLGSFLSAFLQSTNSDVGLQPDKLPFRREEGEAAAIRHIRHHSKYLAGGSLWERIKMACAQIYGMVLNNLGILLVVATAVAIESWIRSLPNVEELAQLATIVALALLALGSVAALVSFRAGAQLRRLADGCIAVPAVLLLLALCWRGLGALHTFFDGIASSSWKWRAANERTWLAILGAIPVIASAASVLFRRLRNRLNLVLAIVAAVTVPLFIMGIYLVTYRWAADGGSATLLWTAVAVGWILLVFVLDVNFTSPHRHYRNKLSEAYLIRPAAQPANPQAFENAAPTRLSSLGSASPRAPYHLINCALNVPASLNPSMQGRLTDFFLLSPKYAGSPLTGYMETTAWENRDAHLDLGTAMAISGAAAAPQMGLGTIKYLSFWLALLNIRLGYWLRKPGTNGSLFAGQPGLFCLLKEMTGRIDETGPWLNVSDGGHIENLGVYELLRRRCKYIVAIDGEQDQNMTFHALTTLQRLAAIDLGVRIDVDLEDLRLNDQRLSRSHFRFCRIRYPKQGRGSEDEFGYLLYVKLSLTGNEGEFLRRYRLDEPVFPHHSTADQFFTETQFEAYRSLGEHIGDKLFLRTIVGDLCESRSVKVEDWFRALGKSLIEPPPTPPPHVPSPSA